MHNPNNSTLLLASASPRRREILQQLQIPHRVINVPPPEGEDEPQLPGEAAEDYVRRTAQEKAIRAADWLEQGAVRSQTAQDGAQRHTILCADTTVILDGAVLGKPQNRHHAAQMLQRLSGRTHQVHTAVALYFDGRLFENVSVSSVRFAVLTPAQITAYCDTSEPMGKAGAYGIQGLAAAFVSQLCGSYTGVMGLPAYETVELLKTSGFMGHK